MAKYGRLTVLERFYPSGKGNAYCRCLCDCGNEKCVRETHLKSGKIRSCGCLSAELASKRNKTHGERRTRLYRIWTNMKARCNNSKASRYEHYGGRGITVCEDWQKSFATFRDWALENGYTDTLTIDRIDNDGNYAPDNCRWTTAQEQARNTSKNHKVEFNGEVRCITEWADIFGIDRGTLLYRINIAKMSIEQAVLQREAPT